MRSYSNISALLALSLLMGLGAVACNEDTDLDCNGGDAYDVGEESYCVYTQAVTETGFDCPAGVPNRHQTASYTVCSDRTDIPAPQLDNVEAVVAQDRGEQAQTLDPVMPDEPNVQPTPLLQIDGDVTVEGGAMAPAAGFYGVHTIWQISSGSPDYLYVFGSGEAEIKATNSTFSMSFLTPPPAEALNSYGVGVGLLMGLFDPTMPLAPGVGMFSDEVSDAPGIVTEAAADRFGIIYIAPDADKTALGWTANFPDGYSCGRGVDAVVADDFDTFEPVSCDTVVLRIATMFDVVNWT